MKFELVKSVENHQWYWRFLAPNNHVIATGGEGYVNRLDALHSLDTLKRSAASAVVYEQLPNGHWQEV